MAVPTLPLKPGQQALVDRICAQLESGDASAFIYPWTRGLGYAPRNGISNRRYGGYNRFATAFHSIVNKLDSPIFLTQKQITERGGHIRPTQEANACHVIFAGRIRRKETVMVPGKPEAVDQSDFMKDLPVTPPAAPHPAPFSAGSPPSIPATVTPPIPENASSSPAPEAKSIPGEPTTSTPATPPVAGNDGMVPVTTTTSGGFFMREYKVWNLDQTEGVKLPKKTRELIEKLNEVKNRVPDPVAEAQRLGDMLKNADIAPVTHDGGGMAFYRPATHSIHLPHKGAFANELDMYEVLAHETIHATGAKHLLNRPTLVNSVRMGTPEYALEELTAVMGALFLLQEADASITPEREKNWGTYLKGYDMRKVLKENPSIFIRSLVHAEFASQFVAHPELRPEFMKGRKAPNQTEIEFEDYALTREKIGKTPDSAVPDSETPSPEGASDGEFVVDSETVREKMMEDLACIGEVLGHPRSQPENEIS